MSNNLWAIIPGSFDGLAHLPMAELTALALDGRQRDLNSTYSVKDGTAHIDIRGVMVTPSGLLEEVLVSLLGGCSTPAVTRQVQQATTDPAVKAIALAVDSPGGSVVGVSDLAAAVRAAAAAKTTTATVGGCAASAAFWAISGATRIVASSPTSVLGSLGAYRTHIDFSEAAQRAGIHVRVIGSGPLKGAGEPGAEVTPEQLAEWQKLVDGLAAILVGDVAAGRRMPLPKVQKLATGAVWLAQEAMQHGLVDSIGGQLGDSPNTTRSSPAASTKTTAELIAYADTVIAEFKATAALHAPNKPAQAEKENTLKLVNPEEFRKAADALVAEGKAKDRSDGMKKLIKAMDAGQTLPAPAPTPSKLGIRLSEPITQDQAAAWQEEADQLVAAGRFKDRATAMRWLVQPGPEAA